ncbi:RNA ligase family protein [Lysinibacillus capsici]|uniref:ATP-dependent DNA ligase n=1 Tax=Lysinibacillus capsici TaxID=2115968 RepID=UPI002730A92B|nr:RNA ligase family protein [Lysinibacillus capsici]MDP1392043.1 RNA ligase family protein [Lysinibacillus capsici]MDP1412519.1 RNA ligase family protein [Lysinibacillus capsici]MDP1428849.1 RNA ligase family protein [Lysinibacillus capsici]
MLFTPIKPMLLQMGNNNEIDDNPEWIYDIKWDGWRILVHKEGDRVEAYTRHGNNVTSKFPELQEVGQSIQSHTAIIDCEGVVLRNGVSVFDDFAYRGRLSNKEKIKEATVTHPATFIAFDVLATDKVYTSKPLVDRKEILSSIIEPSSKLLVTPSIVGNGSNIFQLTKDKGMEGIVGKQCNSIYKTNHRSHDWLKYKHFKIIDAVILGYKENPFTMLVGTQINGKYKPLANVEFGFKLEEKTAFREIAKQIVTKVERDMMWVEPILCCKVQYLEKTNTGSLRIVSFKGFNFDKVPEEIY